MVVAFATEYQGGRAGPFHFLDEADERRFAEGFANCRARKLGTDKFRREGRSFHVHIGWTGIPTQEQWLSYYALSLPKHAIPISISIRDPRNSSREYRRTVARDDESERYVIYLECASSYGLFDFELTCEFVVDPSTFMSSSYTDARTTTGYAHLGDDWTHWVSDDQKKQLEGFLAGSRVAISHPPAPMAMPHQQAALPLHMLIVGVFGILALGCIGGGIYAIVANATSKTDLELLGAHLSTGHVGVAFVGIGLIIAFFTVRAVLNNLSTLAGLPLDSARTSKENHDDTL